MPARAFSRRKGKLKGAGGRWAEGANESVAEFVKREREQVGGWVGEWVRGMINSLTCL